MRVPVLLVCALMLAASPGVAASPTEAPFVPPPGLAEGWYAQIETSLGRILVHLLPDQAPQSVAYFAALAEGRLEWIDPVTGDARRGRYYDRSTVYVAKAAFHFQVGDRTSDGTYSPLLYVPMPENQAVNFNFGYRIGNMRVGNKLSAARLVVTAGAQPGLTSASSCFGEIVDGKDVVFNITAVKTNRAGRPLDPVVIERIRVFAVGQPAPLAEPVPYIPEAPKLMQLTPN